MGHPLEQCVFMASDWNAFGHFFQGTFSPLTVLALCVLLLSVIFQPFHFLLFGCEIQLQ